MSETETRPKRSIILVAVLAALAGALITLAIVARPDMDDDDDEEEAVVSAIESTSTSSVDLGSLAEENGIEVATLEMTTVAEQAVAYGTVADVTELIDLVRQDRVLEAHIHEASVRAASAAVEEDRLAQLNADDRNASDRDLEVARTEVASSRAALDAARSERDALRASASRRWGLLAAGMLDESSWSKGVTSGAATLLEVALRADLEAPTPIHVMVPGSGVISAELLCASPRVDAQFQQRLYDYLAMTELPVGLRVTASVPTGRTTTGVVVPSSAVVWSAGSAWVFLETGDGRFTRQRVDATRLVEGGYLETALSAGDQVVTRGAQQLLSQQHKPEPED